MILLKIQLAQIYGKGKDSITVRVPSVQQQTNGTDCCLYAIANIMEFGCNRYKGLHEKEIPFVFVQEEVRKHYAAFNCATVSPRFHASTQIYSVLLSALSTSCGSNPPNKEVWDAVAFVNELAILLSAEVPLHATEGNGLVCNPSTNSEPGSTVKIQLHLNLPRLVAAQQQPIKEIKEKGM